MCVCYTACFLGLLTQVFGVIGPNADSKGRGGFPGGSDGEESTCNAGDPGLILGSGRSPGEGNGYLLQYSCPENPMDRGTW